MPPPSPPQAPPLAPSPYAPSSFDVALLVAFSPNATAGLSLAVFMESIIAAADTGADTGENVRVEVTQNGQVAVGLAQSVNSTSLVVALEDLICSGPPCSVTTMSAAGSRRLQTVSDLQLFSYSRRLVPGNTLDVPAISGHALATRLGIENSTISASAEITLTTALVVQTVFGDASGASQVITSMQAYTSNVASILQIPLDSVAFAMQPYAVGPPAPPPLRPPDPFPMPPAAAKPKPPSPLSDAGKPAPSAPPRFPVDDGFAPIVDITSNLATEVDTAGAPMIIAFSSAGFVCIVVLLIISLCLCRSYCPQHLPGPFARLLLKKSPSLDWPESIKRGSSKEGQDSPTVVTEVYDKHRFTVTLRHNSTGQFRIKLAQQETDTGVEGEIFISHVDASDVPDDREMLCEDDTLIQVNDVDVVGQSLESVQRVLQAAGSTVDLTLERPVVRSPVVTSNYGATIRHNSEGKFCILLAQNEASTDDSLLEPVYVSEIGTSDVPDDRDKVANGDQVCMVNGVDVTGEHLGTVQTMMQASGAVVDLVLQRPVEPGAKAALAAIDAAIASDASLAMAASSSVDEVQIDMSLDGDGDEFVRPGATPANLAGDEFLRPGVTPDNGAEFARPQATPVMEQQVFDRPPRTPHVEARPSSSEAAQQGIHVDALPATPFTQTPAPLSHYPPASPEERDQWKADARQLINIAGSAPLRAATAVDDHVADLGDLDLSLATGDAVWVFDGAEAPVGWLIAMKKSDDGTESCRGIVPETKIKPLEEGSFQMPSTVAAPTPAVTDPSPFPSPMGQFLRPDSKEARAVVDAARVLLGPVPTSSQSAVPALAPLADGAQAGSLSAAIFTPTPAAAPKPGLLPPLGQPPAADEGQPSDVAVKEAPLSAAIFTPTPAAAPKPGALPPLQPPSAGGDDDPPSDVAVKEAMPRLVEGLVLPERALQSPGFQASTAKTPPLARAVPKAGTPGSMSATNPLAEVQVPAGTRPGELFRATIADGRELTIACPADAEPGDFLEIELPPSFPSGEAAVVTVPEMESPHYAPGEFETVEVAVPADKKPGDTFSVQASWGGVFEVSVPRGTKAGSTLFIEVPRAPTTPGGTPAPVPPGTPVRTPVGAKSAASFSLHV